MRWARAATALLLVALAAGAWSRFAGLGETGLYGDEAEYALVARELREHPFDVTYSLDGARQVKFVSHPHLALAAMALVDAAFGPSDATARATVAGFGVLGIFAAYLLGRELRGPLTGAGAAALVAVLPVHVHLSRQALLEIPLATCAMFAAWGLLRWLRVGTRHAALVAGLLTAAAVLAKLPGVLVPVALVAALALQAARERLHHGSWSTAAAAPRPAVVPAFASRAGLVEAGVGAAAFLAVLAVYALYVIGVGAGEAWLDKMAWQWGRVDAGAGASKPWTAYLEGADALPARMGPALWTVGVLGLAASLAAWALPRRSPPRAADVVLVVVPMAIFLFFAASDRKVWFYVAPVAPFLAVLGSRAVVVAGEGARALAHRLARRGPPAWRRSVPPAPAAAAFVVAILVLAPATTASFAFSARTDLYGDGHEEACTSVRASRVGEEGMIGSLLGRYALRYYCPEVPVYDRFRSQADVEALVAQGRIRWLVTDPYHEDPDDAATFRRLLAVFPNAEVARFGALRVVEFRPTNATLALDPVVGAGVVRLDVVVANRPSAPPRDLTGETANFTVFAYTEKGWTYPVYSESLPLEGDWSLEPGASRNLTWTWTGRSYWGPHYSGTFHVRLDLADQSATSPRFAFG